MTARREQPKVGHWVFAAIVVLLIMASGAYGSHAMDQCNKRGGVVVRGYWGFDLKCVKELQ